MKVEIEIRGIQRMTDDPNTPVETVLNLVGELKEAAGKTFVTYTEASEDGEATDVRLKFDADFMEMTRKGNPGTKLSFEQGKKTGSSYGTPYGSLLMAVNTFSYVMLKNEKKINLHAIYDLEINDENLSHNEIFIDITEII